MRRNYFRCLFAKIRLDYVFKIKVRVCKIGGVLIISAQVIAIDFDGTLCENKYPAIGKPNAWIIEFVKQEKEKGNQFILWTCREGQLLEEAVAWCKQQGVTFDAVNANIPERVARFGSDPRKVGADLYIDDRAIGVFWKTGG